MEYAILIDQEEVMLYGFQEHLVHSLALSIFSSEGEESILREPLNFMDRQRSFVEQTNGRENIFLAFAKKGFLLHPSLVAEGCLTTGTIISWLHDDTLEIPRDDREWLVHEIVNNPDMKLILHTCACAGFRLKERIIRQFPPREIQIDYAYFLF